MKYSKKEEIWKDVPGYEKFYQVSSAGRVRSKDRVRKGKGRFERPIKARF